MNGAKLPLVILSIVLCLALAAGKGSAAAPAGKKIDLRILYAGYPGSQREKDFVEFLGRHFREVKTGNLAKFTPAQSEGVDVTILDGLGSRSQRPSLPRNYTKPVLTVGVTGARICSQMKLKTGYL